ncbi:MAG: hypothetical protein QME51_06920, partial [Planctomycetota bacterium]|nr:hypothetical protein [Planctomycetota bacterium]
MPKRILITMVLTALLTSPPAIWRAGITAVRAQTNKEKETTATPPVKKVVLYKHGLGYFERIGKIRDNATVTLDFRTDQMQDLLTSLYAIDYGKDCKI